MESIIERLGEYIIETLSIGTKKFMGICRLLGSLGKISRRIDILITTKEEFPFALLYFTGSKLLNTIMRKEAAKQGFRLNEKSLINLKTNKKIILKTEKEIFEYIGYKYLDPTDRNNILNLQKLK